MSTEQSTDSTRRHKVLNLYGPQIHLYQNARGFVLRELETDNPTEGEVVSELSRAYLNDPPQVPDLVTDLVPEHASENGDEVYTYDELVNMGYSELRDLAAGANTNVITGKSVKMRIIGYFACR